MTEVEEYGIFCPNCGSEVIEVHYNEELTNTQNSINELLMKRNEKDIVDYFKSFHTDLTDELKDEKHLNLEKLIGEALVNIYNLANKFDVNSDKCVDAVLMSK